ncbi:MAG: hypothetical protein FJ138_14355 [Deltaproteobacteria bacterium]|nr:hypothetical protein [Deltaproteobacteria bacterium]
MSPPPPAAQTREHPHADAMSALAAERPEVVCVTCGPGARAALDRLGEPPPQGLIALPEGVEGAVAFCAGLAREGYRPFLHASAAALARGAYELIATQVAAPCLPVRLVGLDGGLLHEGGVAGQALEDLGLMCRLPNLVAAEGGDAADLLGGLRLLDDLSAPVYLRAPARHAPELFGDPPRVGTLRALSEGAEVLLVTSGVCTAEAQRLTAALKAARVSVTHLHAFVVSGAGPALREALAGGAYKLVVTMEAHLSPGPLAAAAAAVLAEGVDARALPTLVPLSVQQTFAQGGALPYLLRKYGLDAGALLAALEAALKRRVGVSAADLPPSPWGRAEGGWPV